MKRRFVLAPEAANDLLGAIWRHIRSESGLEMADKVEAAIRERIVLLSKTPGVGHWRTDLTAARVRFFPVYSYLVVYRPDTRPLQVVAILHGKRDVGKTLRNRL